MTTRIEKRWAALDQPLFVLCLVLNAYECLERFGDKSAINIFTLNTELIAVWVQFFLSCRYSFLTSYFDSFIGGFAPSPETRLDLPRKLRQTSRRFLLHLCTTCKELEILFHGGKIEISFRSNMYVFLRQDNLRL
jgi:hypothetical protein